MSFLKLQDREFPETIWVMKNTRGFWIALIFFFSIGDLLTVKDLSCFYDVFRQLVIVGTDLPSMALRLRFQKVVVEQKRLRGCQSDQIAWVVEVAWEVLPVSTTLEIKIIKRYVHFFFSFAALKSLPNVLYQRCWCRYYSLVSFMKKRGLKTKG